MSKGIKVEAEGERTVRYRDMSRQRVIVMWDSHQDNYSKNMFVLVLV